MRGDSIDDTPSDGAIYAAVSDQLHLKDMADLRTEKDRLAFELKAKTAELEIADGEIERLRKLLDRLHDWASASNDWRPDSQLGRDVRAVAR